MGLLLNGIVMWSGSIQEIPSNWALCDGNNGTPDLRDRFILSTGSTYSVGQTGGSANAVLISHNHTGSTNTVADHTHTVTVRRGTGSTTAAIGGTQPLSNFLPLDGAHAHSFTTGTTGSSATNANLPPYYALAFIMQILE